MTIHVATFLEDKTYPVRMQVTLLSMKQIVFKGRSLNEKECMVQVALVTSDGSAFGGLITLHQVAQQTMR
jgi:hypothetical protein